MAFRSRGDMLPEPVDLHTWWPENKPCDKMVYKGAFDAQLSFVASQLRFALVPKSPEGYGPDAKAHYEKVRRIITVPSTHLSKSILLPTYHIDWSWFGVRARLRDNFHDWKVTVESEQELKVDPRRLFDPERAARPVYCEGFDESWVLGPYSRDKRRFTVELSDSYQVYTFFHLVRLSLEDSRGA